MLKFFNLTPFRLAIFMLLVLASLVEGAEAKKNNNRNNKPNQDAIRNAEQLIKAANKHREYLQKGIKQTNSNLEQAKKGVSSMESIVRQAEQEVANFRPEFENASGAVKRATAELKAVEQRLEAAQPSDSPLRRASADLHRLQEDYARILDSVKADPEFQAAYQKALDSPNKLEEVRKVRTDWLERHPKLRDISLDTTLAREKYEAARREAILENSDWQTASFELQSARSTDSDVEQQARLLLTSKADAASKLRRAQGIVTSLQQTIVAARKELARTEQAKKQAESRLNSLRRQGNNKKNHRRH